MNTLTTIENVEVKGSSWVATLLGGKPAGTTDQAVGEKLLEIFNRDPENCLAEVELEKRGEKLWILSVNYIEAPPELGGPADESAAPDSQETMIHEGEQIVAADELVQLRNDLTVARVALGNAMTLLEKLL